MPGSALAFFELVGAALMSSAAVTFVVKTLIAVAITSVFAKKQSPSQAFSSAARDQQITSQNPVAAGRVIYGETRVGGIVVFLHTTDILQSDPTVYMEEHTVAATVTVQHATQFIAAAGVFVLNQGEDGPLLGDYTVDAGVYSFDTADDYGRQVRISYTAYAPAKIVGKHLHIVIELACHEVEEIGDIYFDDELIPLDGSGNATGRLAGHAYVAKYTGDPDQVADSVLMAHAQDKWTADHRLRGRAYIYVRLVKNADLFPNGLPNIRAQVKGRKVYDPRTSATAWSDNVALCIADYLTNTDFGLGHVYADEIDEDLLIAAANICDESVALAGGGTENRYTCNGAFLTSEQPKDILGRMKVAFAGHVVRSGGRWGLHAGAYSTPTVTLDEDDLRGGIQVKTRLSRREVFNAVKGVFASPDNGYQPADFPAVSNATYYAEDQDERIWFDMDLPFTDSASMAQRLAKIELERVRQQITVVLPCQLTAWAVAPPQTVMLSLADFGWSSKVFEVVESRLVVETDDNEAPVLGVDLVLRETASTVFDWSAGEETTVDPAPDTDLPDPFEVAPPGSPTVTETLYQTTGSAGLKTRAVLSWSEGSDALIVSYQVEYRLAGASAWTVRPLVRGTSDTFDDLAPGSYAFRVKGITAAGISSGYATATGEILGLTAAPEDVSGFSVIKSSGIGIAQWALHPALDVQINGAIVVRHSPLTSGATWLDGVIYEEFPGGLVSGILPLKTGTYMAKARDSSGNYSEGVASFVATEGLVSGFSTAGTVTESPGFSGTMADVAYDMGLSGVQLDGSALSGSYTFNGTLDLSTVATRRFEAAITAVSYDAGANIDSLLENIDQWDNIDGAVVNDCDLTLYGRFTDDDPSGSPTWTGWTPFFVADFTCRAAQFRLDFVRTDVNHNIYVTDLAVTAKVPT